MQQEKLSAFAQQQHKVCNCLFGFIIAINWEMLGILLLFSSEFYFDTEYRHMREQ
jgi:hypothetical protein